MKSTLNISKETNEGIVKELDGSKYFLLNNSDASRAELFNFALALGLKEGRPTPLTTSVSFIRTSYVENVIYQYKSVFYDKDLSTRPSDIDEITDTDKALYLVEQYANTGFGILTKLKHEYENDLHLMTKLLNEMDRAQKQLFGMALDSDKEEALLERLAEDQTIIPYSLEEERPSPMAANTLSSSTSLNDE